MSRLFRQVLSDTYAQVNIGHKYTEIIVNGNLDAIIIINRAQTRTAFEIQELLRKKFGARWLLVA